MKNLLGQLRPEDRFNVVLFAGATDILSKPLAAGHSGEY